EYEAGLIYEGQSGALNESWSDVFGAMVERYAKGESDNTWKMGEECKTPGIADDADRYLDSPEVGGDPDHFSERLVFTADCSFGNDNCGVHANSGIANKAFYLLAKGGTHSNGGSMGGIGADKAA